ncbi:MAG: nitroreductase family protein [Armatimonadota bacterium]|nr:nitroreductase family protein [Armatimonadota bacterium]MCX7778025.1 nitroreductase family protein [Armatimonadota bacterium]MDW8024977.1 nitroreductase family protein [Armatimonadota bacterium]
MPKDAIEAIMERRSIRKYKPEPIPREHLTTILEAGRQAPSAGNRQPWRFVVVRDHEVKRRLGEACNNQNWIADADVIVAGLSVPAESERWHDKDVMIAMQNMIIAATALGYGTCWIGAFNHEKVKEVLGVPEDINVVALTPIGVPDETPRQRPRKEMNQIFFSDRYGEQLKL